MDLVRWKWQSRGREVKKIRFPLADNDPEYLAANRTEPTLTWIGHATFLLQHGGTNILTDPHLSDRASPFSWIGPKRLTPPGLSIDELPPIDVVVISHNHYDHLDAETIEALHRKQAGYPPLFVVPDGVGRWFTDRGIERVVELKWWESTRWDDWTLYAVPAQHFSGRSLSDRNRSLWAGWVLQKEDFNFYFAGDTGYSADFKEIGKQLGPFDLSAIPIGAYAPRWFMQPVHVNPEEAVRIHKDVGSNVSIGMHWGTFLLTDEALDEPPKKLAEARRRASLEEKAFLTLRHGQTVRLDSLLSDTNERKEHSSDESRME